MFNEARGHLNNSKTVFLEKINDSFGHAIVRDVHEPMGSELQKIEYAWNEAEIKKMEIKSILMELRMII